MGNSVKKDVSESTQRVIGYLGKMELFRNEKPGALLKIAQELNLCEFQKEDFLLKEGDESSSLFIIADGVVEFISLNPATGRTEILAEFGRGRTFGEFGLVYDVRRTAGAIAKSETVVVLRLDRAVYDRIKNTKYMRPLSARVREVCAKLMGDGLQQVPFLKQLNKTTLEELAHLFKFEVIPKGAMVCKEGAEANKFFIVYHGHLVVTMEDEDGFPIEISRLQEGMKFGDLALLTNSPRTASVTALKNCELFSLDGEEFKDFIGSLPEGRSEELIRAMFQASYSELLKKHAPILNSISLKSQQLLGWVACYQRFSANEILIQEGTTDNQDIYVLCEGEVTVLEGRTILRSISTGYFGEVSLFNNKSNTATVKAKTNGVVLRIPVESFTTIMSTEQAVYAEIAIRVMGKAVSMGHILKHPDARKTFLTYCEKEYAQENLDFWLSVKRLEAIETKTLPSDVLEVLQLNVIDVQARRVKLLSEMCEKIFNRFVKEGAVNEINISSDCREQITNKIQQGEYTYDMFLPAKVEVFRLLEADNFARYKESLDFQTFLQQIGVYKA